MTTMTFNEDALFELPAEAFRVYTWMALYLPKYSYEISYRELAGNLFMSPTTVRKHMDWMVQNGWVERSIDVGFTASYRIIK